MFPVLSANTLSTGYNLTNSLRFRASASAYLNRTPGTAGNRTTWTWSAWVKLGSLSSTKVLFSACTSGNSTGLVGLQFTSSDTLQFFLDTGSVGYGLITTQVFRDPSAWYHIVVALDTTQATSTNRIKLYINGSQVTAFGTATYPALNDAYAINNTQAHNIGRYAFDGTRYFDGYITEVNLIDGQALTPSSFGSTNATTGVWQPAKYTGTYGTNGIYQKYSSIALTSGSNTGLGQDFSGNGNYFNTNNISVTAGSTYDAMSDVPTLTSATVANYAVMNPLTNLSSLTVSNANLNVSVGNGSSWKSVVGTMALPSTGKWYWEVTVVTGTGSSQEIVGVANTVDNISASYSGSTANTYGYQSNASKNNNGAGTSYGASYTTGDVIGVAVDTTAGTIVFYKNNTSQGTAFTGLSSSYSYVAASSLLGTTSNFATNFGQRPFAYTPPTGYVALNTYNLPDSTVVKGNTVMDATLYTGTGSSRSVTNAAGFKPDFAWVKCRSTARSNVLVDSNRGVTKVMYSNNTNAEITDATSLTAFNTNGFSVGSDNGFNANGDTFVGWQWQAGQGSTTTGTGTGGITSVTQSVNATAGFSIVTYTGSGANGTVTHGLGVAPKMVIVKARNNANGWIVWHTSLTSGAYFLDLQGTAAQTSEPTVFQSTIPNSTVVTLGTNVNTNRSAGTFVLYSWAEISQFSKFGSYTGNGSTDGPFVYTGFRPKFVMYKITTAAGGWVMLDTSRTTYNVTDKYLLANASDAEGTFNSIDILSNGFKVRNSDASNNPNGGTVIYMAFAENPLKNSLAR